MLSPIRLCNFSRELQPDLNYLVYFLQYGAAGASTVFFLSTFVAYHYIRRVYNRFVYIDDSKWDEMSEADPMRKLRHSTMDEGDGTVRGAL